MLLSGPWCVGFEKDREQMEKGVEQQQHTKEIRNNVNERQKEREWLVLNVASHQWSCTVDIYPSILKE